MLIPEPRHCQHVTVLVFVRWLCTLNINVYNNERRHNRLGHVVPATHQQRDQQLLLSAEEDEELT